MAVTLEYQAWTSATYNWLDRTTATSAPVQIDAKLRAWITAVNANPSNASKQITIEKGLADGTGNFVGWVIKIGGTAAATAYIAFFSTSATAASVGTYQTWATGTANGGYGTFSGNSSATGFAQFNGNANAAEFIVSTETADTEEFFCLGYKTSSSSISSGSGVLLIFKDTAGEWATVADNNGSAFTSFYMPTHTTPQRLYGGFYVQFGASQNISIDPLCLRANGTGQFPAANNFFTTCSIAKSPHLYASTQTSIAYQFGRYAVLANGRTAICPGYAPIFVSYI
jgi:hypothetical protein